MTVGVPLLLRRRVLAAKIETTVGTAETLTAAEAAMNIFEPTINPTIEFEERPGQGVFSPLPGVLGAYGATTSFQTEITGRGSSGGSVPLWASTFLPACGFVDNGSGVFGPVSKAPGVGGVKTVTIGAYQDGVFKRIRGAMGTFVITLVAGKIARIQFTFTGIWDAPTDAAMLAPTYPTVSPLRFVSSQLAVGSWNPKLSELSIDAGNQVALREDAGDASGFCSAVIGNRRTTGSMNPEASLVADNDNYGDWLGRTEQALGLQLGSGVNRVDIDAPKLQFTNTQEGDRNNIKIDTIEFQLNRSAAAGDDDLTIDFN